MLKKINWPTAAVAITGLVLLGAVALFGKDLGIPDEVHAKVLAALASVEAIVLAFMKSALFKPDIVIVHEEEKKVDGKD